MPSQEVVSVSERIPEGAMEIEITLYQMNRREKRQKLKQTGHGMAKMARSIAIGIVVKVDKIQCGIVARIEEGAKKNIRMMEDCVVNCDVKS